MTDRIKILPAFIVLCLLLASFSPTFAQSSSNIDPLYPPEESGFPAWVVPAADESECIVPLILYEVSFTDLSENKGKTAWTCQTAKAQAANYANDPIFIYMQIYEHNLNTNQTHWEILPQIEPGQSLELDQHFYSGKGGASNSQVEYYLPLKMVAIYATEACRSYASGMEPPPLAQSNTVALYHPCPGPDGDVIIPRGEAATEQPAEPPTSSTEEAQPPENSTEAPQPPAEANPSNETGEKQDPLLTGLMYVLFTSGDLRGFENTPEGRALSAEERVRVAEFLSEMGLLTHFGDTLIYPEKHPCYGLTSRELCEKFQHEKQLEIEKERQHQAALDQAENEYIRRQRINRIVQEEVAGRGRFLFYAEDILRYIFKPTDPRKYATDKFEEYIKHRVTPEEVKNMDLPSYEEVLRRGITAVIDLATSDAPYDYDRYLEFYHQNLEIGLDSEEAHTDAIEKLKQEIIKGRPGRSGFIEAYGRAFQRLNRVYGGGSQ